MGLAPKQSGVNPGQVGSLKSRVEKNIAGIATQPANRLDCAQLEEAKERFNPKPREKPPGMVMRTGEMGAK
jgi:hypothetical protein